MKTLTLFLFLFSITVAVEKANALTIIKESGWLESAYVTWFPVEGADSYNVYYSGEGFDQTKIDTQLIREYKDYYRADVLGLKKGKYTLTVKAVNVDGVEFESATSSELIVNPHIREGFAFVSTSGRIIPGGYNEDGTLKNGARVIYVSAATINTVSCNVVNERGVSTSATGLMEILAARGKGYDKTPLVIRMIGLIKSEHIAGLKGGDYISFIGSNSDARMIENITIEGVGNDATAYGYGFFTKRSKGIEIRNLGIMLFGDDGVSMEADNFNIWVHNNDFFYGAPGGDSDQVKGDGSIDMKYNTTNITISFNHFWDSGKSTFAGGATESNPIYFTYHHNWFDHSDSRHPRLCHATAHIYNNYFDGNATMCILNTEDTSAFIEGNYFRNCPYPMMINMQGTNYEKWPNGEQNGGMTKAFNNKIEGARKLIYQTEGVIDNFDAYLVSSRNEQIPNTVISRKGGNIYSNFDTAPDMYAYNPDSPDNVKTIVTANAGRIDGGDFKWVFDNAVDDVLSTVNIALKSAIIAYQTSLVSIQGIENGNSGGGEEPGENPGTEIGDGTGGGICELLSAGPSSGFTINGSTSNSKGSVTVNNMNYDCCLKMGSTTSIAFTITETMKFTLLFNGSDGKSINIDNGIGKQTIVNGKIEVENLPQGTYTVTRSSGESYLFYILLDNGKTGIELVDSNNSVYFNNGIIYNPEKENIQVYDTMGRIVLSGTGDLNATVLTRGIYLLHILNTNTTMKIVW